ncbi:MAG TPA: ATP-grasp domain-containing protein [Streptosporangiaceae bacterium]|nr:ATP-grasp domain-containing protein [Streptosporangiaceae bacterium]
MMQPLLTPAPSRPDPADLSGATLLVLGSASPSKRGLFEAARARRARVVAVKHDATWEREYCDAVLDWDCADYTDLAETVSRVSEFARSWAATGVVTTADAALPALAEVARECGMPGPEPGLVALLRDKTRMRERFADLGLPSAVSIRAGSMAQARDAAARIGLPVIVKPATGTGSRGVLLVDSMAGLQHACEVMDTVAAGPDGRPAFVVEEFIEGPEVCVDAVAHAGEVIFQNVLDKPRPMNGPLFEEVEFITPSGQDTEALAQALKVNEQLLHGLGLADGIGHTEMRLTSTGPRLIETHLRVAGQRLPEIVARAVGVDFFGAAVDLAMGLCPDTTPRPCCYAGYQCVYSARSGILRAVEGLDDARQVPGVTGVEVVTAAGEQIRTLPEHTQQNIAYIHAEGPSYGYVRQQLAAAAAKIRVDVC